MCAFSFNLFCECLSIGSSLSLCLAPFRYEIIKAIEPNGRDAVDRDRRSHVAIGKDINEWLMDQKREENSNQLQLTDFFFR